jgi:drug/metabolite transporter (DMT)-like permease
VAAPAESPARAASARGAALFVVLAGAAFATSGPLARLARPAHPLGIALGRVTLAALVLSLLDVRGLVASVRATTPRQRALVAGVGALLAAHFALFLWGLEATSLPAAISLVSLEPLSVVVAAWALAKIRPTPSERVGVLVATVGALVVALAAGQGEHRLLGDALVVGAVVLYGVYVSAARVLQDALPPRHYAVVVYAVAALVLLPAALLAPAPAGTTLWPLPARSIVAIVAAALIPTVLGHTMVQTAARSVSPSVVALVSPGETLGGLLIGALMLGAVPSGAELVGAAIIVAGATAAIAGSRRG